MGLRTCAVIGAMSLLTACPPSDGDLAPITRTDSTGVTIVTSNIPVADLVPVLTVAAEPRVRIGAVEGSPEQILSNVRSITRLSDGRIVVGTSEPSELRVFDDSGRFVARYSRAGRGPGELQYLSRVYATAGDTLHVMDNPAFRLLRFTVDGRFIDMRSVSRDSVRPHLGGQPIAGEAIHEYLANGSVVVATGAGGEPRSRTGELYRPLVTVAWISRDYRRSRTLGTMGQIQQMFVDVGGGRRRSTVPPNARRKMHALGGAGTRLCVSANESPDVHCVDESGAHLLLRWRQDDVPTADGDVEQWREDLRAIARTAGPGLTPQVAERMIEGVLVPPTKSPIGNIIIDASRRVFVTGPDLAATTARWHRYRVFSASGELIGIADLPPVEVHEIGEDWLLGVDLDADGVEFVVLHDVKRGTPAPIDP